MFNRRLMKKTKGTSKKLLVLICAAYFGVFISVFAIVRATYLFITSNIFNTVPLYGFVLFYGYFAGAIGLMLLVIHPKGLLRIKIEERERTQRKRKYAKFSDNGNKEEKRQEEEKMKYYMRSKIVSWEGTKPPIPPPPETESYGFCEVFKSHVAFEKAYPGEEPIVLEGDK